ncbi:uncharacterized protein SPPG_01496 [Spizellomyces punctatus DAOM BR117]|uniref:Uncharacterized protein n=1 Tax=Spizellomyces punctatus (strain DAOM BR117) TaxID=645134 RepID=A0A0L0HRQ2_SPIPD|nr:uncharacterized protein SPPG_01496 [Spizellomyces punctatus DAOM BR117]KND04051.1 hypothetical protein SPPG_01496 [Spizellomyces punctatus DAOM BR117]|eukprot:XP_016612090.1 hypothetical protein SPPG_01496 [Spizellomyces punctatus DAOM BR117]
MSSQDELADALIQQRGREAELELEVRGLRRTIEVLKNKNASLSNPPEEHTQKIEILEAAVKDLQRELRRQESEHDDIIERTLNTLRRGSSGSVGGKDISGEGADRK